MDQITKQEAQQRLLYQEAAAKILEEFESRGFTSDEPLRAIGLTDKITDIILETVRGNTSYCVTSEEDGDLENQGPAEDYPPWHPLES